MPLQSTEVQGAACAKWILQKVLGAAAEYPGAGSRVCNNESCRGCRVLLLNAALQSAAKTVLSAGKVIRVLEGIYGERNDYQLCHLL